MTSETTSTPDESGSSICSNCQSSILPSEVFCSNCGFPENGTEEQKHQFKGRVGTKKRLLEVVQKEVRKGRNTLLVLAGLNILSGLYFAFLMEDVATAVVLLIVSLIYIGLAIYVKKQPFAALLTALIIYLTLILADILVDPSYIFRGIIVKAVIIGFLVKGVKSGHEARNIQKELRDLGVKDVN